MMLCNREIETMTRAGLIELQTGKLRKLMKWLYEKSAFYSPMLDELALVTEQLELADLAKLPFTTHEDLAGQYPYGLLTFPLSSVARVHTIGQQSPVAVAYTSGDIGKWLEMLARTLVAGGLNPTGTLQIAADYGLQPEGLGLHYAAEAIGATVLPAGIQEPAEQIKLIEQFGVTALAASPAVLKRLAESAEEIGMDLHSLPISTIYAITTEIDALHHSDLAAQFNATVIEIYSVPELLGPGIAGTCSAHNGLHIQEDYFYPEIVDPVTGKAMAEHEQGELVLTTLGKEAMPVLRYRTGLFAALDRTPCTCGRTLARLIVKK